ncbi:MAG: hypothetical protein ACYTJ0_15695, partial [Planctomycetota bacterium]
MLPGLLAGVILIAGWPPWRHVRLESSRGLISTPVALTVAVLACFVYKAGWWRLPPTELWQRMSSLQLWQRTAVLAIAAAGLGVVAATARRLPAVAVAVLAAILAALVMKPPENPEHAILGRWALAVLVLGLHAGLAPLARRRPGPTLPIGGIVSFAGASLVLVQARNANLGLMAAALSAACGWALLTSLLTRQLNFTRGGVTVPAIMLPALLVVGAWYDYGLLPLACFVLPALAPLTLWIGEARS